jgi:hypothetical protein
MLSRIAAAISAVFGLFGLLCVSSVWAFAFGAFLGALAVALSTFAMRRRPGRLARAAAVVGGASGGFALLGSALWVALWILGV